MIDATNATNATNSSNTTLNFAGIVLQRLCKGNTVDSIYKATHNHMNPFQLVSISCLLVAVLALVLALKALELYLFDLDGDGKVDCKDFTLCLNKCCRTKKTDDNVNPTSATKITNKSDDDENDLEKGATNDNTNDTGQDKDDIKTVIRERVTDGVVDEASSLIETTKENVELSMDSTLAEMDPSSTSKTGNAAIDAVSEKAKESADPVLQGWLPIIYTLLFGYSAIVYLIYSGVQTVSGTMVDTIFCKSAQIVLIPLFKPATLSLWPAYLPIVQMVYWIGVTARVKRKTEKELIKTWFSLFTSIVTSTKSLKGNSSENGLFIQFMPLYMLIPFLFPTGTYAGL